MTRSDDSDPQAADAPPSAERAAIGEKNTPDMFKKRTAQTNGERVAVYQSPPRAPHRGEDTQKLEPAVVLEQTHNEGFSGAKIREYMKQIEEREGTTVAVPGREAIPRTRHRTLPLLVLLGVLVGAVLLFLFHSSAATTTTSTPSLPSTTASAPGSSERASASATGAPSPTPTRESSTSAAPSASETVSPRHSATQVGAVGSHPPASHSASSVSSSPTSAPSSTASSGVYFPHI